MSPRMGLDLQTIIQAAVELADTHGIDEVTLASLAGKLEIRSPSLYNHVNGLHGLRKKLAIHGLEQLHSVMTRAAVGRAGDDAVRALAEAYISFARAHPGLYEATLRAPDPQDPDIQRAGAEIVELAVRVLSAYDLEDEAALHAVRGLRSILHGFASLEQRGGFGLPLDLNVSLLLLIDTFLAGIHIMKSGTESLQNPE
ncbi:MULTISPECIES: TetR/AcrR family transcriptional regulator [unclassified Paenibacillus]|uniref:TetR/AcrR family transcriptional regulator n=1 Tax=unclassified Paenibacillus TaxID=185978 RepID=UPI001AEAF76B|nr:MULTISPECIES: TetR/AcrR family transcriptional regulator [unclassified Paenibacillus]MBP1153788.1 AcrR family transcriptional regulator [Paenibacillus sp. PvP091]MBP1170827.1 AcrR family transcriptional regulator [Paenibacillus sp. PvR098]MBP2441855.1 AcrR family transcriptional regulator [Paenibacillus sp. PvP052]